MLIVDDDAFNRQGVRLYLETLDYLVLEAADETTAYEVAVRERPAVVVVDIVIPPRPNERAQIRRSAGIRLARRLKKLDPSIGIVLFSAYEDRGRQIWDMVRDGARGFVYILKGALPQALADAIEDARDGRVSIDSEVLFNPRPLADELLARLSDEERVWVEDVLAALPGLTEREWDIAQRLAAAHMPQSIADQLGISVRTVENHVGSIYHKVGLRDMGGASASMRKSLILAKACIIHDLRATRGK